MRIYHFLVIFFNLIRIFHLAINEINFKSNVYICMYNIIKNGSKTGDGGRSYCMTPSLMLNLIYGSFYLV